MTCGGCAYLAWPPIKNSKAPMPPIPSSKLSVEPGQFKLRGCKDPSHSNGWRIEVAHGEAVLPACAQFLKEQVIQPRWTLLQATGFEPQGLSLVEELFKRDYDLSTLRLSVFTLESKQRQPKRLSVPSQRSGYLKARWGRLAGDNCPDFVSTWELPASRRDSSMLQHFFSTAALTPHTRPERNSPRFFKLIGLTLLDQLTQHGFDIKTLQFSVRHKDAPK